jgi:hypothetical protein
LQIEGALSGQLSQLLDGGRTVSADDALELARRRAAGRAGTRTHARRRWGVGRSLRLSLIAVVVALAIVVPLLARSGPATVTYVPGAMPDTRQAQAIEAAVVETEKNYDIAHGSPSRPVVSYVDTTAADAYAFLDDLPLDTGVSTSSGGLCEGEPSTTQPPPGVTTTTGPPQVDLLHDQQPVALVELTGVTFEQVFTVVGGICSGNCTPVVPPAVLGNVAFVVVLLKDGSISGWTLAEQRNGSSFSLSGFGSVTSWLGPADRQQVTGRVNIQPMTHG